MNDEHEKLIERYFNCWVENDISVIADTFSNDIDYVQSDGNAFRGIDQITHWFKNWFRHGSVLAWPVYSFVHQGNTTVCKWRFDNIFEENQTSIYGVSWIVFDSTNRICKLSEYIAESELCYPFDDILL